ncbi:hypothetical protein PLESTB_001378800 [Pleodorina starrii]|uniref:Uncharacterized protein n=1 Tax=Pleodorina starrii TaxID=330485 RepID=A0A9W6BUV0_9CHLO|nr:hypothetical protein PLESTB_001378800 [Pleodorina starrii]
MAVTSLVGRAFEKYFYDFSLYDTYFKQYIKSRGQYVALRHVAFVMVGVNLLIDVNFPFNPPFPTIGMCPAGKTQHHVRAACRPARPRAR